MRQNAESIVVDFERDAAPWGTTRRLVLIDRDFYRPLGEYKRIHPMDVGKLGGHPGFPGPYEQEKLEGAENIRWSYDLYAGQWCDEKS